MVESSLSAELKECRSCSSFRSVTEFNKCRKYGYQHKCRECEKRYREANRARIAERIREYQKRNRQGVATRTRRYRLKKLGLSMDDYLRLQFVQQSRCAGCGRAGSLHVDHSHRTGQVRGLLCGPCNRALGLVRDSVEILRNLAHYLMDAGQLERN